MDIFKDKTTVKDVIRGVSFICPECGIKNGMEKMGEPEDFVDCEISCGVCEWGRTFERDEFDTVLEDA